MRQTAIFKQFALVAIAGACLAGCKLVPWGGPPPVRSGPAKVRVAWTAESAQNLYGFNIYRGRLADGPWTRVNPTPILAAGGPTTNIPHDYEYVDKDDDLMLGQDYWYWLESIDDDGTKKRVWWPPAKVVPSVAIDEEFPPRPKR